MIYASEIILIFCLQNFQVVFERELFSICDGLSGASRIGQLLSFVVDLDITDDVCS